MFAHALRWVTVDHVWVLIGFLGQGLFTARFVVQWFKSEIAGKSVIPLTFWYFSVGGGLVLFAYAIHQRDPVFICGQGGGLVVYARNLYLIYHERKAKPVNPEESAPSGR